MNFDVIIKYLIWIVFLGVALTGLYFMLRNLGVLG